MMDAISGTRQGTQLGSGLVFSLAFAGLGPACTDEAGETSGNSAGDGQVSTGGDAGDTSGADASTASQSEEDTEEDTDGNGSDGDSETSTDVGQTDPGSETSDSSGDETSSEGDIDLESGDESSESQGDTDALECDDANKLCDDVLLPPGEDIECLEPRPRLPFWVDQSQQVQGFFSISSVRDVPEAPARSVAHFRVADPEFGFGGLGCGRRIEIDSAAGDVCTLDWWDPKQIGDSDESELRDPGSGRIQIGGEMFEMMHRNRALSLGTAAGVLPEPWGQSLSLFTDGADLPAMEFRELVTVPEDALIEAPAPDSAIQNLTQIEWQRGTGLTRPHLRLVAGFVIDGRHGGYEYNCDLEDDGVHKLPEGVRRRLAMADGGSVTLTRDDVARRALSNGNSMLAHAETIDVVFLTGAGH